jgi:uncharacterized membrane protein
MWGFGLLVCGGVVALIALAFRRGCAGSGCCRSEASDKGPIDYLDERYARGEIDREEYERTKTRLEER